MRPAKSPTYGWLNDLLGDAPIAIQRRYYLWPVLHAAHFARVLGVDQISVIEFGVGHGNGLVVLEAIAEYAEVALGVGIDVYGFDTGHGLPPSDDYRDTPNLFRSGAFAMEEGVLRKRLRRARLVLGDVRDTVPEFLRSQAAPVGFISFDLDYYSSTTHALKVLTADPALVLPRVHCYFDEIAGYTYSAYNGERLAIEEFNSAQKLRKVTPIYGLRHFVPSIDFFRKWPSCIYLGHVFDHPLYNQFDGLNAETMPPLAPRKGRPSRSTDANVTLPSE